MMLEGIRVLEIAQNLAGPMAAEILAHLGADVVKIERPEGDDARRWGPPFWKGVSPGFLAVNANKRSITVDLKDKASVAWVVELAGQADVLVQSLRPGALDELGLGPTTLIEHYPRLIYCSVWAFGARGPLKLKPGYEPMGQAFETRTGPLIVGAGNDRLFAKLAGVLGHPEWVKDPRFVTNAARVEHRAMLCAMIDEIFAKRPKGEWIDRLEADGVPCAVINSLPDAAAHAQTAALDMIQPMPGDDFALVALPLSFDGRRPRIHRAPPAIGQHNPPRDRPARWPEG